MSLLAPGRVVAERVTFLFQAIGYGIGHVDWIESKADQHPALAARYRAKLEELAGYPSGWLLDACRNAVQHFSFSMSGPDWKSSIRLLPFWRSFLTRMECTRGLRAMGFTSICLTRDTTIYDTKHDRRSSAHI